MTLTVVLSAKSKGEAEEMQPGRLLIRMRKSIGPRVLSCRMLEVTGKLEDIIWWLLTPCLDDQARAASLHVAGVDSVMENEVKQVFLVQYTCTCVPWKEEITSTHYIMMVWLAAMMCVRSMVTVTALVVGLSMCNAVCTSLARWWTGIICCKCSCSLSPVLPSFPFLGLHHLQAGWCSLCWEIAQGLWCWSEW